nr:hypothetical protein [Gammaproteobacteria bacterium]
MLFSLVSVLFSPTDSDPDGDGNPDDPTFTNVEKTPALELIKHDELPIKIAVGEKITYIFEIINTGNVSVDELTITDKNLNLDNVEISDAKFTLVEGNIDKLAPNETVKVSIEYKITQADIDSGKVINTATVTGKDPQDKDVTDVSNSDNPADQEGQPNNSDDDNDNTNNPTVAPLDLDPQLTLTKGSSIPSTASKVGDLIAYTFTVVNTGKVTIKDVTISDQNLGLIGGNVLKLGTLAPGETRIVKEVYQLQQKDIDAGKVVNTATVNGMGANGKPVSDVSDSSNPNDNDNPANPATDNPLSGDGKEDNDPTVTSIQRLPVATNDSKKGAIGEPVKINVLENDTDPDGKDDIDPTSVKLIDKNGNEVTELNVEGEGTWTVNPTTGEITFTPEQGVTDDPTPVQYVLSDKEGNQSNPAVISVDYPTVADRIIVSDAPTVREADETYLVYDVKLSNPVETDVVTTLTIDPQSTATVNDDFIEGYEYFDGTNWVAVPNNGEITLPKDGSAVQVRVTVKDDEITELNESVVLKATTDAKNVAENGRTDTGTGIIEDDKPTTPVDNPNPVDEDIKANIVVKDAQTIVESKEDYLIYTVKLDRAVNNDVLTKLSIAGDSAEVVAGQDYAEQFEYFKDGQWVTVPAEGIELPAEGTDVLVRVKVLDDAITENDEAIILTATTTDAQIDKKSDTGKGIIEDDKPTTPVDNPNPVDEDIKANLVVEDAGTVKEGKDVYLEYDVKLDKAVNNDVLTKLSTSGTATAGKDYEEKLEYKAEDGTWKEVPADGIELPAEGTPVKVRVKVIDDLLKEPAETVILKAETTDSQMTDTGRTDTGTGEITDEEDPFNPQDPDTPNEKDAVLVSIVDKVESVNEGETATFPIELKDQDGNPVEAQTPVTVELTYTGTAEDGKDYTSVKTIVIPKGQTTANLDIKTLTDNISGEPLENVQITINQVSGGGFEEIVVDPAHETADVNIQDITEPPKLSIDDQTVNEDAGTMTFTVTLDGATPTDSVTVDWTTVDGSAKAGEDYTSANGTLTFAPNETTKTITIDITDDYLAEATETFDIQLTNAVNATIVDDKGVGTILDEATQGSEDTVYVEIVDDDDSDLAEDKSRELTVQLHDKDGNAVTAVTDVTVDVAYTGTDGNGVDFEAVKQVTINAGSSNTTLTVKALDDYLKEGQEKLDITISNAKGDGFEAIVVDSNNIDADTTGSGDNDPTDDKADIVINDEKKAFDPQDPNNPDNQDAVFVKIAVDTKAVVEGGEVVYTVSIVDKNGNPVTIPANKGDVDVTLNWVNSTANPADITETEFPTTITIAKGTSETKFTLNTADDNVDEPDETLIPEITAVDDTANTFEAIKPHTTANGAPSDAITTTTTIIDNDDAPIVGITIPTPTAVEGEDTGLVYDVSIENGTILPTDSVVHVKPNNADNVSPADVKSITYTKADGTTEVLDTPEKIQKFFDEGIDVTIPAGKTTAGTIKVVPVDDNIYEISETLQLDLTKPDTNKTTLTVGSNKNAVGTITDEDNPAKDGDKDGDKPTLDVGDSTVVEGETLEFDVTLTNPVSKPTTLTLTPNFDGDANTAEPEDIGDLSVFYIDAEGNEQPLTANGDGTYTIPANVTQLKVKTTSTQDNIYEQSEKFTLKGEVSLPDGEKLSDDGIGT